VWFRDKARHFRETTGKVDVCKGCYHHCFISPALFRTPQLWPRMVAAVWEIHRNLNSRARPETALQ
jgi:hypothetical protein